MTDRAAQRGPSSDSARQADQGSAGPGAPGRGVVQIDALGTAAFVVVTGLASVWVHDFANLANLAISGFLFVGGCLAFTVGFLRAVGRSEGEDVDIAGVVYLTGSAPRRVRRAMLGLWFVQIATAGLSVFTVHPPFGVMAPVWGVGLLTVWASRYGTFPSRPARVGPGRRSAPQ